MPCAMGLVLRRTVRCFCWDLGTGVWGYFQKQRGDSDQMVLVYAVQVAGSFANLSLLTEPQIPWLAGRLIDDRAAGLETSKRSLHGTNNYLQSAHLVY